MNYHQTYHQHPSTTTHNTQSTQPIPIPITHCMYLGDWAGFTGDMHDRVYFETRKFVSENLFNQIINTYLLPCTDHHYSSVMMANAAKTRNLQGEDVSWRHPYSVKQVEVRKQEIFHAKMQQTHLFQPVPVQMPSMQSTNTVSYNRERVQGVLWSHLIVRRFSKSLEFI